MCNAFYNWEVFQLQTISSVYSIIRYFCFDFCSKMGIGFYAEFRCLANNDRLCMHVWVLFLCWFVYFYDYINLLLEQLRVGGIEKILEWYVYD